MSNKLQTVVEFIVTTECVLVKADVHSNLHIGSSEI